MSLLKKCILHIGLAKTGTTQIQQFIKLNGDLLNKNKISWAIFGWKNVGSKYVHYIWKSQAGAREWINQLIGESEKFIFSSEDIIGKFCVGKDGVLFYNKNIYLDRLLSCIPNQAEIELLVFIRNYSSWIESSYCQVCFNRPKVPEPLTIDDYLDRHDIDINKLDWFELISSISSVERISKVTVCPYESYRKNNELFYRFFESSVGMQLQRFKEENNRNVGISAPAYEILMASRRLRDDDRVKLRNFLTDMYPVEKYDKPEILSHDIRKILSRKYMNDINRIKSEAGKNVKIECLLFDEL